MRTKLLLSCFMILSLCTSAQLPGYLPESGLVGWYPFNGNALDESGHHYDPTYTGSGVSLATDRHNNADMAYFFNGADYIRIPADSFPQNDRTIALWFNVPDVSNRPMLMGYGGEGYLGYGTSFLLGINIMGWPSIQTQAHYTSNMLNYYYPSEPLNEWYHLAISISGNTINCYVNGELKATENSFTNPTYTYGRDLAFGVMPGADGIAPYTDINGGYLLGKLDDIGIWNRSLTGIEIEQLFTETISGISKSETISFSCNPNPATGHFVLTIPFAWSGSKLRLFNSEGQINLEKRIDQTESRIDISVLPAGVYLLRLMNENNSVSRKLLIY